MFNEISIVIKICRKDSTFFPHFQIFGRKSGGSNASTKQMLVILSFVTIVIKEKDSGTTTGMWLLLLAYAVAVHYLRPMPVLTYAQGLP